MWLTNLFKKKKRVEIPNYDLEDELVPLTERQYYRIYKGAGAYNSHPAYDGNYWYHFSPLKKRQISYSDENSYYHHLKVQKFNSELCSTEILEEC